MFPVYGGGGSSLGIEGVAVSEYVWKTNENVGGWKQAEGTTLTQKRLDTHNYS